MRRSFSKFLFLLVFGGLAGGAVFLATWNIPAPVVTKTIVLSDDRFPH